MAKISKKTFIHGPARQPVIGPSAKSKPLVETKKKLDQRSLFESSDEPKLISSKSSNFERRDVSLSPMAAVRFGNIESSSMAAQLEAFEDILSSFEGENANKSSPMNGLMMNVAQGGVGGGALLATVGLVKNLLASNMPVQAAAVTAMVGISTVVGAVARSTYVKNFNSFADFVSTQMGADDVQRIETRLSKMTENEANTAKVAMASAYEELGGKEAFSDSDAFFTGLKKEIASKPEVQSVFDSLSVARELRRAFKGDVSELDSLSQMNIPEQSLPMVRTLVWGMLLSKVGKNETSKDVSKIFERASENPAVHQLLIGNDRSSSILSLYGAFKMRASEGGSDLSTHELGALKKFLEPLSPNNRKALVNQLMSLESESDGAGLYSLKAWANEPPRT